MDGRNKPARQDHPPAEREERKRAPPDDAIMDEDCDEFGPAGGYGGAGPAQEPQKP